MTLARLRRVWWATEVFGTCGDPGCGILSCSAGARRPGTNPDRHALVRVRHLRRAANLTVGTGALERAADYNRAADRAAGVPSA